MGGGKKQIDNEVETFRLMKEEYPKLKGLFISYIKNSFTVEKQNKLTKVGYRTLVLQDNAEKIKPIINKLV